MVPPPTAHGREIEPATPAAPRRALGILFVVCSAFALGLSPSLARFAYAGGVDVMTLAGARGLVAGAVILAALTLLGRPVRPTAGTLVPFLGLGVTMTLTSYGYLGAIRFIPVGLAVLTFFTFPLLVGIISRFTEGGPLPWPRIAAIVIGFAGLMLALGVSLETLDPRGIGLGLLAAVSVSIQITVGARLMRRESPLLVTGQMMLWAGVILAAGLAVAGGPQLPESTSGWLATFGVAAAFMVGISCFFAGVSMIGPAPAALIANLEPLVALGFAFLLLGEVLEPLQFVGAALVIGAIVTGQLSRRA